MHQYNRKLLETCKSRHATISSQKGLLSISFGQIYIHEALSYVGSGPTVEFLRTAGQVYDPTRNEEEEVVEDYEIESEEAEDNDFN